MRRVTFITLFFFAAMFALFSSNFNSSAKLGLFHQGSTQELSIAKNLSLTHIGQNLDSLGLRSVDDLQMKNVFVDELSMAHTKFQQTFDGVPVFGGEAIVHLNQDGSVFTMTDSLVRNIKVDVVPSLNEAEAINRAVEMYGCGDCLTSQPQVDMFVMRRNNKDRLVYRVQLSRVDGSAETAMPVYFIDAHTGKKVWGYNNLQTGSGPSLYNGTVTFGTSQISTTFYMEDLTKKIGTFDARNAMSSTFRFTDTNDVWDGTTQRAAIDAHYGLSKVLEYYSVTHGRNGIDGSGGPNTFTAADGVTRLLGSVVHFGSNYNNAFWDGSKMTYGDGDNSTFSSLVTLDICGHEVTHGVTERTAGLIYSNESGALNESMSDVFGALIERYVKGESGNTWKIGEECYTPSNGTSDALRYMDEPTLAANSGFTANDDPDFYPERYTGTADNGGVHINSGIANKAFYLVAKGGAHRKGGSMVGIGADKAGQIWYKALTTYMTSSTNFAGARTATLNAATVLYGGTSAEFNAVATAWGLCGVGTVPGGGGGGGTGTNLFSNGGFETSVSPTVLSGTGALYVANGNFPKTGTGYIYFGAANSVTGTAYQQIAIPSTATSANLTFWLNVSSDETTTTTQYDQMFVEVRNTSGTLLATLATYSNLNKATAGSYTQRGSFSLLAYKGQTVRVQFRVSTDSSALTTFRVDDVVLQ
jgi:Zn-dependent metalloprotease